MYITKSNFTFLLLFSQKSVFFKPFRFMFRSTQTSFFSPRFWIYQINNNFMHCNFNILTGLVYTHFGIISVKKSQKSNEKSKWIIHFRSVSNYIFGIKVAEPIDICFGWACFSVECLLFLECALCRSSFKHVIILLVVHVFSVARQKVKVIYYLNNLFNDFLYL